MTVAVGGLPTESGDRETLKRTLVACIRAQPFADRASCCRIVHLFGAWWRFRRLASFRNGDI